MKEPGKILIVDDNEDILLAAQLLLKKHYTTVITEKEPKKIPVLLNNEPYDVILLDMNFSSDTTSGREGFYWLKEILKIDPSAVVIFITAFGDVEKAVKAIKEGAFDFILKPWQNEKLLATVSAALQLKQSRQKIVSLQTRQHQLSADCDQPFKDIIGTSSAIKKVFATVKKVAVTDANILILGENGTGKELFARAVHRNSQRSGEVFISVDMATITPTLFESELFGHIKGAFTDARADRAGRFEAASGGTLFLDEIANLPTTMQAKLLTVLQNRTITRVGSNKEIPIDIRLVCATNMPIYDMVKENKFRQDLLYRINTIEIQLPALRERIEDIPLLIDHYINLYNKKYHKEIKEISSAAMQILSEYQWPGNVRELQHAIERAVILSESKSLNPSDFFLFSESHTEDTLHLDDYNLDMVEKLVISKTLNKHNGNVSRAAKELGVTRAALYRRLEKYGI
jgi:two-component system response regulator HydG